MATNIAYVDYFKYYPKLKKINESVYNDEFFINKESYKEDKYDAHSIHIVAEKDSHVIGYMRVILPNQHGLPALELITPYKQIDLNTSVEFSRLMVHSDYRKNNGIGMKLMKKGFDYVFKNGYSNIIIDVFLNSKYYMFKIFKQLGFDEFSEVYQDSRYINSPNSIIMHLNIYETIKKIDNSPKYRQIKKYFIFGQESLKIDLPAETNHFKEIK